MPDPTHIAVLDDYLSLSPASFASLQNVSVTHLTSTISSYDNPDMLSHQAARLAPFPVISTMRERTAFPAALLTQLPNLRLLLTTGPRNASIDMAAAASLGIIVTGTAGKPTDADSTFDNTSQHCWSLILALASRLPDDDRALKTSGSWQSGTALLLAGKTFGAVGLGRLGGRAARTAILGFGMKVVAWSENLTQQRADETAASLGLPPQSIEARSKREVFGADVVSLHYVLSDRSRGIVGQEELSWMKPEAMLVNTSRAGLVDEHALLDILQRGKIRGVALDVFWEEPLPKDSIWRREEWGTRGKSMVVLSPHMGYVEAETMKRWYTQQAEEIERWRRGEAPRFRIN